MPTDLIRQVENFFTAWSGEPPQAVSLLPASGSSRRYFRIAARGGSVLCAYNNDKKENAAFIGFTRFFRDKGMNVPEIPAVDSENGLYLLQDLGDETLFSYLESHRSEGFSENIRNIYREVLQHLIRFQHTASQGLDYSLCYPRSRFDRQSMMWDLNYFKYYFLKLAGIHFDEQKLEDDFESFTAFLSEAGADYFMYRDFQSRNIMLVNQDLWYIDYQGGRLGPRQYDLASLLYDAKANIPQEVREELLSDYLNYLSAVPDGNPEEFKKYYYGFVFIRIMQAMGAYGFRGYYEKKPHFLKSIPYAVENLRALMAGPGLPIRLPAMENIFHSIISSPALKQYAEVRNEGLHVRIFSFSYKKSIPPDSGGNGGGFVFDCRAIPNPGRFEEYKQLNGKDHPVIGYLEQCPETSRFFENTSALTGMTVDNYIARGFSNLMISFGCTGGQHRSVYFAERMFKHLRNKYPGIRVSIHHKELE